MRPYVPTCSMGIHRKSVWLNLQEILSLNTSSLRGRFSLFSIERSLRIDFFFFFIGRFDDECTCQSPCFSRRRISKGRKIGDQRTTVVVKKVKERREEEAER